MPNLERESGLEEEQGEAIEGKAMEFFSEIQEGSRRRVIDEIESAGKIREERS